MIGATPGGWDLDTDFVAVGSGLAGTCAALAAYEGGLKTIVVEKSAKAGGVCGWSGGEVFVPANPLMREQGLEDSVEKGREYLRFLGGGYENAELQDRLLGLSSWAVEYCREVAKVQWKLIRGFPDYHHPHAPGTVAEGRYLEVELFAGASLGPWQSKTWLTPHAPNGVTHDEMFQWGGLSQMAKWDYRLMGKRLGQDFRGMGPGMMGYFIKAVAVDRAIPVHLKTSARGLIQDEQGVAGLLCESMGKTLRIRARCGVLLGCGGYDWHPEFPRYFEGLPEWNSMVQATMEGDNLVLGGDVGASLAGVPGHNLGMFFGYQIPGETSEGRPLFRASWEGGYPHALWVDQQGKRFADESFYRDYLPKVRSWDGVKQGHPHYPPYLIVDQQYRERYVLGTTFPGQPLPEGFGESGDTPEDLALKLGIDPVEFRASLDRFNDEASRGVDSQFGRGTYPWAAKMTGDSAYPNPNLGTVCKPPFHGIRLRPVGVGINSVGLRTDTRARVLNTRGQVIPGLYAAGNAAACLDLGAGYQSGLSNLRGIVWGLVAGRHAAGQETP